MSKKLGAEALSEAILAVGTEGFAEALRAWLASICSFDNIAIIAFFQDRGPEVLLTHANDKRVFERIDTDYVSRAYLLDPFFELHQNGAADGVYRLSDIAPDQFHRNEYFKSYYKKTLLEDELAFFCGWPRRLSITVCLGRDATTSSRFSSRDQNGAKGAAPVVNALVKRNWDYLKARSAIAAPQDTPGILRQRLSADRGIELSGRQSEIALLILQGHSSVSVGLTLGISPQTVKVIRKQLYKKCQISSLGELYYLIAPYLS